MENIDSFDEVNYLKEDYVSRVVCNPVKHQNPRTPEDID